jgi:hypothetical protein
MKKLIVLTLVLLSTAASAQQKLDVVVKQVHDRRANGFFSELTISMTLPKVRANEVAASRVTITSAVDETGRDLLDPERKAGFEPQRTGGQAEPATPASVSVALKNPDRKATKVKEVRGEIELFMPAKDPNSIAEIAKFTTFSGKALSHKALKANGVDIALVSPAQVEAEKKKRADAKKKEYAEMGFEGEDLANMLKSFVESLLGAEENDLYVRVKDPGNRIQEIEYVDSKGEVQMVSRRDEEGMTLLSTWAGKPQPDWKLRVSMKTPKNVVKYTFALADVPLP